MSGLMVLEEVAKALRVSPRTVSEMMRARSIPHRRLRGLRRCLFIQQELAEWLDGLVHRARRRRPKRVHTDTLQPSARIEHPLRLGETSGAPRAGRSRSSSRFVLNRYSGA